MKNIIKGLPFYIAMALNFYVLPLCMIDTGGAILVLLVLVPVICFVISMAYGRKHGFHFSYAIGVAILFIPSIGIFYNSSAWVYSIGYGGVALIGNLVSSIFKNKQDEFIES